MNELRLLDAVESETRRDLRSARRGLSTSLGGIARARPRTMVACGFVTGAMLGSLAHRTGSTAVRACGSLARRSLGIATRTALAAFGSIVN